MGDIANHANLVSGHSWQELKEMLDNQAHEPQPQIYSVKAVAVPEAPMVLISLVARTKYFEPWKIRAKVIEWFEYLHPTANPNRGRLSGTQSLTFGAQTGRVSDRSCVIKRTTEISIPHPDQPGAPVSTECGWSFATVFGFPDLEARSWTESESAQRLSQSP